MQGLVERGLGRHDELLPRAHHIDQRRAVVRQRLAQRAFELLRILDPHAFDAHRIGHGGEVGVLELAAGIEEAARLHLHLDEAQRAVVEHDHLHRQAELAQADEVAHHHGEAAVARHRDDLPRRVRRLGADRLQQRVGHRAVVERADQAALAVHLEVARRPHGLRADVAGEDRVIRRDFAHQAGDILRVDDLAAGLALGELVEVLARLLVMGERAIEELAVGPLLELGQQRRHRGADIADDAQRQVAAIAEALRPDVDLHDPGALGIELAVGEVGAEQQERVAVLHRRIARGEADEAGHADVERIVVFDIFLAAQRMHDRAR